LLVNKTNNSEEASAVMGGCPEKDFKTPQPSTFKQHWIHAL
jgi:hypothetical protein